ncbi:hypothetical protein BX659_13040 [Orenia metallireducens]|uniref:DUF501 domain-containing protein n=1 Tax=Orenia metallireducens TaxID=1413210 RepID=A0A285H0E0_9FIRM|nr:DUF501 domain-containing protein [Orenia metallireducens]PRX21820.1 hypothetical protein BX659_13040 [Orenia metallireducens]SNY29217.1 hypothetical protein SAMN06265827_112128 [Orenia metallireducens]
MGYNQKDLEILERQLGRKPRNLVDIIKRCKDGSPQVVVTAPILDKGDSIGIFPTTLWLTCPELNYRIGKLESRGLVQEVQNKILGDKKLSKRLAEAHKDYANYRMSLVEDDRLEDLKENNPGQYKVLKESGVGGILEFEGIKCLHTHFAQYLVDEKNPVGEMVAELLKKEYGQIEPEECSMGESLEEE